MNINNHIQSLQKKHDDLQRLINAAFSHLHDDTKIKQLKKQKLMLKDKILLLYKNITSN
ncbi:MULTISPECIES: DUF465 domain-containing protein [unclassified Candidatus Tisiphia]|jgi:hypothetical protein|uniref:DUF465 domain-containing protein n=1 Tax=unclassified Candidatus Tisiphia TaxID=2996318 RepID=UPI001DDD24A3|nr:DUF465 domain-containing protein [Rickettsia endosymbiont of Sericostoma sp. HW-2014]